MLGVVVAVVILGAIGFGFYRHWTWKGRSSTWGVMPHNNWGMPHDYDDDMPCEEDSEALCEGYGTMPCGGESRFGMGRMPCMHGGPRMYGGRGWRGHSPLTGLLFLVLVALGVWHFTKYNRYRQYYHYTHTHQDHHNVNEACCKGDEPENANTQDREESQFE